MKSDFHFHFYSRLGIMAILLFVLFFVHQSIKNPVVTKADPINEIELGDWAWSDILGWVSLNCANDFSGDGNLEDTCDDVDYGLKVAQISEANYIQGCAWAGTPLNIGGICETGGASCITDANCGANGPCQPITLGWLCFSDPGGTNAPVLGIPLSATYINALDSSASASIIGLEDSGVTDAWKLEFPIENEIIDPSYPINGCFNCYTEFIYKCNNGNLCGESDPGYSCPQGDVCTVREINYNCDNCLEYFYYDEPASLCSQTGIDCSADPDVCSGGEDICVNYNTGDLQSVVGAYQCSDCVIENENNICGTNAYEANLNRCNSCDSVFSSPGLMVDHRSYQLEAGQRGYLCGWGYNDWAEDNYSLGWFQFGPRISTSTRPYIGVDSGSIYSKGEIFGRYYPPYNQGNASFLIESGGTISNFISSKTLAGQYQGELPHQSSIDFFSYFSSGKYKNALGTIDYNGLITPAYIREVSGININYNKYESAIYSPENTTAFRNHFSAALNGKTIYYQNDLTIDDALQVRVGDFDASYSERASATIVVEGDLTINDNINYQQSGGGGVPIISNLKQIPSLVWVVKGDVYIHPDVSDVAGTFVVLGNGNPCSGGLPQCGIDHLAASDASCGRFVSCATTELSQCSVNQIKVSGSVLARRFELCRTYYDENNPQPAEFFINDGRLQVNPPFGFIDFSRVIPRFSEF